MKILSLAAAGLGALFLATTAEAQVSFTSTAFYTGVPSGQTMVDDFDHPIATGFTLTGGALSVGSTVDVSAAPAGDSSQYLAAYANQSVVLNSRKNLASFSAYFGSIDTSNYIGFYENNKLVSGFTGGQLTSNPDGSWFGAEANRTFDFSFNGDAVNKVVLGSSSYSFEFDNLAASTVSAAPEPGTWLLMIAGIAMLGAALRFSRRRDAFHLTPQSIGL